MAITTVHIGRPCPSPYGPIQFEREAGGTNTIKARIIGNRRNRLSTINDITVKSLRDWGINPRLSDLPMARQDCVIQDLSTGRRELIRKVTGSLIISLPY